MCSTFVYLLRSERFQASFVYLWLLFTSAVGDVTNRINFKGKRKPKCTQPPAFFWPTTRKIPFQNWFTTAINWLARWKVCQILEPTNAKFKGSGLKERRHEKTDPDNCAWVCVRRSAFDHAWQLHSGHGGTVKPEITAGTIHCVWNFLENSIRYSANKY